MDFGGFFGIFWGFFRDFDVESPNLMNYLSILRDFRGFVMDFLGNFDVKSPNLLDYLLIIL